MFKIKSLLMFSFVIIICLFIVAISNDNSSVASTDATLDTGDDSVLVIFTNTGGSLSGDNFILNQDSTNQIGNLRINGRVTTGLLRTNPNPSDTFSAREGDIKAIGTTGNYGLYFYDGNCWRNISDWGCKGPEFVTDSYNSTLMIYSSTNLNVNTTLGQVSLNVRPWLTGWGYRKMKTINGTSSGAQTNYQMGKIRIHKGTGTDSNSGNNQGIQHIYVGSNVRDDFGDIRFTKSDGTTEISYWMEYLDNADSADFWVKVDNIAIDPNTTNICIYYGNSSVTTTSNLTNTFIRSIDGTQPLYACFNLDENTGLIAGDSSGIGNNGTLTNGPVWTTGKFYSGLSFDGTDDYVITSTLPSALTGNCNFSVEFWLKSYTGDFGWYVTFGTADNSKGYHIGDRGSGSTFYPGYWAFGITTNIAITRNVWEHWVVYRDGTTQKVYKNGSIAGTYNLNGATPNITAGVIQLGKQLLYAEVMLGVLDEVRIYNRALTDAEISDLYNNYGYTTTHYPKRVLVRKFATLEPTWGVTASEESSNIGTLLSTNILFGHSIVSSIDSFNYIASSIPSGTSMKAQFSRDNTSWYNSTGLLNGWNTLSSGTNSIALNTLSWSGPFFYYKVEFNTPNSNSPVLDEIKLHFIAH